MEFTKSTRVAISFMLRIIRGEMGFPEPAWTFYDFFHKIEPGKVKHVRNVYPDEHDDLRSPFSVVRRDISFYLLGDLVATVTLEAVRPHGVRRVYNWEVCRVCYAKKWTRKGEESPWEVRNLQTTYQLTYPTTTSAA